MRNKSEITNLKYVLNQFKKKADAILTADWHLREDVPTAYVGDFYNDQWEAVDFVSKLQEKHFQCPVLHAGDLFDHWKPSPKLLSDTIEHLPVNFYSVAGNHDLPQHNLSLIEKSGIYTLDAANIILLIHGRYFEHYFNDKMIVEGRSWGEEPTNNRRKALLWHVMTYQAQAPFPGCTSPKAGKLLRTYKNYDLIVTGDNHTPFVEEYKGRLLVNPGSLMRQTADQIDFKPRVYLWYADANTVEPVFLPFKEGAISRSHLDKKSERDNRISAFISKLSDEYNIGMSFEDNLERFKEKNSTSEKVMQIIYKSLENE